MLIDARSRFAERTVEWIRGSGLTQPELQARLRQMGKEFNTQVAEAAKAAKKEAK